jgi:tetratricopeptide (TPR) repeat protein
MGERENAVAQYEIALTMNANLAADFPTVTGYQTDIVSLHQNIGNLQMRMGKRTEALQHLETAASVLEQLTRAYPAVPTHAVSLGSCYCNLGNFWMSSDQPAALQWFTKSEAVLKPVWEKEPRDTKVRSFLRNVYGGRASVLNMLNRFSEAADDWKLASELDEGRNKAFFDQQAIQSAALAEQAKIFERILGGESIELDDADQRAAFALYCHNQKNYLKAAQQYQLALQDKPELAAANRYNAVCSASLALADNQSELLTAEQKTAWRAQALVWLQAELETLADKTPRNRATLRHWLQDSDIAALRDTASLVELPESEREQWTTLWQSVREAVE